MARLPRDIEYREKVGSNRTVTIQILDEDGNIIDMTSTSTYATAKWKVWKPDGTLVINGNCSFVARNPNIIGYTLVDADTVVANAGNWDGECEVFDNAGEPVEQSDTFRFIIEESY